MAKEETSQHFNKRSVSFKKILVFFIWLTTGSKYKTASASRALTVQTGGSIVIPCYYDRKYTEYKKYWCFNAKRYFSSCSILAYANETKGKASVIDHPDQSFFTVTMRNLQEKDTRAYWCAVEIGGFFQPDENEQFYLTVQSAPDVSVLSSSVSGHEGGNVSVQCFYSSGYQNELKQWCRYKDQICYAMERSDTSQNSSVQISDGESFFSVLMTGLRLSDSGWYSCCVGEKEALVQLTVTGASSENQVLDFTLSEAKTAEVTSESHLRKNGHYGYLEVWVPAFLLLLLLIALVMSTVIWRMKHADRNVTLSVGANRDEACETENVNQCSETAENDLTYSSVTVLPKTEARNDVTYSSVTVKPKKKFSPVEEDQVIYSSVHK
ncbi:CMRF35-like molecule 1 [Danio aesculapii]|uniref:CMRF35-like molecule 1 n=1 Tax=Danio aesculapii TaxID=1142201 RepID=UPI0024BF972B|nr:CMRF35-like molecule 1 [Danio aesculapii]